MRNARRASMCGFRGTVIATVVAAAVCLAGCAAAGPSPKDQLTQGFADLQAGRLDDAAAAADAILAKDKEQTHAGAADALYLRGRVAEERSRQASESRDDAAARGHLASARQAYTEGLALRPAPALEGSLRAGLANAAYFLEDYATAAREWLASYDKLDAALADRP